MRQQYDDSIKLLALKIKDENPSLTWGQIAKELPVTPRPSARTVNGWSIDRERIGAPKVDVSALVSHYTNIPHGSPSGPPIPRGSEPKQPSAESRFTSSRILLFDIETLPNHGYFFDTYSERSIPLNFIKEPKSICTVAYKWLGEATANVLVMEKPYDDKRVLEDFLPIYEQATYVVAHFGEGFDVPFMRGRLFANGLKPLPDRMILDTYKVAKAHWRGTLNSNKLDHLGFLLGVGRKNRTEADLWVGCANGNPESIREMAEYNIQDVELLERVFLKMRPLFGKKLNLNLAVDDVTLRCKPCGSENISLIGYRATGASCRPQYRCGDCGAVSDFPPTKVKTV